MRRQLICSPPSQREDRNGKRKDAGNHKRGRRGYEDILCLGDATSCLSSARAAGFQLAILALEDVPVRPAMADRADPLDERGL